MADVRIRITVSDADDAKRAVEQVNKALSELGIRAEITTESGERLGESIESDAEAIRNLTIAVQRLTHELEDYSGATRETAGATTESAQAQKSLGEKVTDLGKKVAEIAIVHKSFELGQRALIASSKELSTSSAQLSATIGRLTGTVAAASTKVATFTRVALAGLKAGIIGVAVAISAKLLIDFGKLLDRMGAAGAAMAVTKQGFDNLAMSIGETGDALLVKLRRATLGTVDDFNLLRVGSFALQTEIARTGATMEQIAHLSTILALSVGKDAAAGFDILTTGIARHSVRMLKQLGIVVEADVAYRKYAQAIGINVSSLSEAQRAQAFTNEVLAVAQRNVARLNIDTDNLAVVNAQAAASAASLRQAFNREVAESQSLLAFKRELLGLTVDLRSSMQALAPAVQFVADAFFYLALQTLPRSEQSLERQKKLTWDLAKAYLGLEKPLLDLGGALEQLDEAFFRFARPRMARLGLLDISPTTLEEELGRPLQETIRNGIREGWKEFEKQVEQARQEAAKLGEIPRPELPPIFGEGATGEARFRAYAERQRRIEAARMAAEYFPAPDIQQITFTADVDSVLAAGDQLRASFDELGASAEGMQTTVARSMLEVAANAEQQLGARGVAAAEELSAAFIEGRKSFEELASGIATMELPDAPLLSPESVRALTTEIEALNLQFLTQAEMMERWGLTAAQAEQIFAALSGSFGEFVGEFDAYTQLLLEASLSLRAALTSGFVELGDALGVIFAGITQGTEDFGRAFIQIIGNLLRTLGQALVAFGVAGLAIRQFISNPLTAIAAGVALIALGSALAASAQSAVTSAGASLARGGGAPMPTIQPPAAFANEALMRPVVIQIVARDIDRAGAIRVIEEINATGQYDSPIRVDSQLINVGSNRG